MGEVVPLRAPVIPRIRQAVTILLNAGCNSPMVCSLSRPDWEMFVAEVDEHLTVRKEGADNRDDKSCEMYLHGTRVRVVYDWVVPVGQLVVQKMPETAQEFLKQIYSKERVDSFMREPHQFNNAQIFNFLKRNG